MSPLLAMSPGIQELSKSSSTLFNKLELYILLLFDFEVDHFTSAEVVARRLKHGFVIVVVYLEPVVRRVPSVQNFNGGVILVIYYPITVILRITSDPWAGKKEIIY